MFREDGNEQLVCSVRRVVVVTDSSDAAPATPRRRGGRPRASDHRMPANYRSSVLRFLVVLVVFPFLLLSTLLAVLLIVMLWPCWLFDSVRRRVALRPG
jgi:hypothetical protein